MRVKELEFAGKKVTVRERKIKELNDLATTLGADFTKVFEANEVNDVKAVVMGLLQDKLPVIFPELTKEDIEEAYPSEVEDLIMGFVDVNFFGVKKVIMPLLTLNLKH